VVMEPDRKDKAPVRAEVWDLPAEGKEKVAVKDAAGDKAVVGDREEDKLKVADRGRDKAVDRIGKLFSRQGT